MILFCQLSIKKMSHHRTSVIHSFEYLEQKFLTKICDSNPELEKEKHLLVEYDIIDEIQIIYEWPNSDYRDFITDTKLKQRLS